MHEERESIETYYAEEIQPFITNISQAELIKNCDLFVDLNKQGYCSTVSNEQKLDWCVGRTLISNKKIYIVAVA